MWWMQKMTVDEEDLHWMDHFNENVKYTDTDDKQYQYWYVGE